MQHRRVAFERRAASNVFADPELLRHIADFLKPRTERPHFRVSKMFAQELRSDFDAIIEGNMRATVSRRVARGHRARMNVFANPDLLRRIADFLRPCTERPRLRVSKMFARDLRGGVDAVISPLAFGDNGMRFLIIPRVALSAHSTCRIWLAPGTQHFDMQKRMVRRIPGCTWNVAQRHWDVPRALDMCVLLHDLQRAGPEAVPHCLRRAVGKRFVALQQEDAMAAEEMRLASLLSRHGLRTDAMTALRVAVHADLVRVTPRVWPIEGVAELERVRDDIATSLSNGAEADHPVLDQARNLMARLEQEQALAWEAERQADRLVETVQANALAAEKSALVDDLVRELMSTWRLADAGARQRLQQLEVTGKYGFKWVPHLHDEYPLLVHIADSSPALDGSHLSDHIEVLEGFLTEIKRSLRLGCQCGRPWKHVRTRDADIRTECARSKRWGHFACPNCCARWSSKHAYADYKQQCKRCEHEVFAFRLEQCGFDFTEYQRGDDGAHDEKRCQRCRQTRVNCVTKRPCSLTSLMSSAHGTGPCSGERSAETGARAQCCGRDRTRPQTPDSYPSRTRAPVEPMGASVEATGSGRGPPWPGWHTAQVG